MGKAKATGAADAQSMEQDAARERRRQAREALSSRRSSGPRPLDAWRCMALYAAMGGLIGFMGVRVWATLGFALAAALFYFAPPVGAAPTAEDGTL